MHYKEIEKENKDYTLFSWMQQENNTPLSIKKAFGVYIYDYDNKAYLDFSSQLMNVNIGHNHPNIKAAILNQMKNFSYVAPSISTEIRGLLGKKLAEITPGDLSKTFFTVGGAEAIENAIKLARVYTQKHKIITNYRSYHGATYGAISAGGDPRKHSVDSQQLNNIVHIENPYYYRCPWYSSNIEECGERAIKNLEQVILYENPNNIAAILMEGESGTSGCIKYPPFYLEKVRQLCDKYDILFIIDEVMSGFGRTGKWFGVDHHNVTPDIMCMAKGLTSGYIPMGAMIVRPHIAAKFDHTPLPLGLTYSAHALAAAVALEVINIYEKENLVDNARKMGEYLDKEIQKLKKIHPCIGDWRNTGLLGAIELVKNKKTKEPLSPWNAPPTAAMLKIAKTLRKLGLFTFVKWNLIFIAPPLSISKQDLDKGLRIISAALKYGDDYCK